MKKYILFTLLVWCGSCQTKEQTKWQPSRAYRIAEIALEATARDTETNKPRPTITSRALAMTFMAMFDAWSAYDAKAIGVVLPVSLRRPAAEHTLANKDLAITHAAYGVLCNVYPGDSAFLAERFSALGIQIADTSLDPTTAVGIGNLAAKGIIDSRRDDGANQYGQLTDGTPYSDYTGYSPKNSPEKINDPDRWQQVPFVDEKTGKKYYWDCLTPHWGKVKAFGLARNDMFRPGPPPLVGSSQLDAEVREVIQMNANLTLEQKAIVEFMRDGPYSVQQAGHWLFFAMDVSRRDKHDTDKDVKLFFAVEVAAMDAFIAAWDAKMAYDSSRPYTLVRYLYGDKEIEGWGGPHKGTVKLKGRDWKPYSPASFCTPSFPSYVSGHSTVSGACSEILKLFTGSDYFGEKEIRLPGALTEPGITQDSITLELRTFSQTAEMAGISRVLGGYHIQADNIEGLKLGRNVAREDWKKILYHFGEQQ